MVKRFFSILIVVSLFFVFSCNVFASSSVWVLRDTYIRDEPSQYINGSQFDVVTHHPSLATSDIIVQPFNLFNPKDLGYTTYSTFYKSGNSWYRRDYMKGDPGDFTANLTSGTSFRVDAIASYSTGYPAYKLVYLSNGINGTMSHLNIRPSVTSPCLKSGVWYEFYISIANVGGISNFEILERWADNFDVEYKDIEYQNNDVYNQVFGKFKLTSLPGISSYLNLQGVNFSFDINWSVDSSDVYNTAILYGFSIWQEDQSGDILQAIKDQTAAMQDQWAKEDAAMAGGVNPGQSSVNDSLSQGIVDLDDFDDQIFSDFDSYKSDLDFGLSAWGEAASGISYIGNIFMIIWENSPNQVIVLSLMLGLCGLVLGRGARLARAAHRSDRGADDG